VRKKLLLLLGALAAAVALLAVVELVLRGLGVGGFDPSRDSRLKYQQVVQPLFRPARLADGREVLATNDPRLAYQWIEPRKPAGLLRVLVFGESAIAGLGFSPNVTPVRELERQLRAACPERAFEIVNLGIVALPSKQVRKLVEEAVASYAPDAVVIYCGNNEFLEIHAEKYAEHIAGPAQRLTRALSRSHLYGVLRGARRPSGSAQVSTADVAGNDQRVSEARMVEHVEVEPDERRQIIGWHEQNLRAMVEACAAARVPCVLAAVAVNWEWQGRTDPPAAWIESYIDGQAGEAGLRAALPRLQAELAASEPKQLYRVHWKLAEVQRRLGDWPAAVASYRASLEADPHLRRCRDEMNAGARRAAAADAVFLDTPAELAALDEHGLVGFADFYDYVHFTPRGAARTAWLVYRELERLRLFEPRAGHDARAFLAAREAACAALERDPYAVGGFLGIGASRERIAERDLWKYEAFLKELDAQLGRDPRDFDALVWRGNARFFQRDGLAGARADYEAALSVRDEPSVRDNLARLLGERRL